VEERRTRDVLASAGHMLQRSHATVGWAATELLERQRRLAAAESEAATRAHGFGAKADMANLGLVAAQVRGAPGGTRTCHCTDDGDESCECRTSVPRWICSSFNSHSGGWPHHCPGSRAERRCRGIGVGTGRRETGP
jgi:hypothetical protein